MFNGTVFLNCIPCYIFLKVIITLIKRTFKEDKFKRIVLQE